MASQPQSRYLLRNLLRDVSRSFYLTLRVLPVGIRDQIGLAYLLARATDTIADTGLVPVDRRLNALQQLRKEILADTPGHLSLPDFESKQGSAGEAVLLTNIDFALGLLHEIEPRDRQLIQGVLETITSGQVLDLQRFGAATKANVMALATAEELDDYTYRVAGCVGDFWTRMCVSHLSPKPQIALEEFAAKGIRFGKGLQVVNILRDIPSDLRNGRCYLPLQQLEPIGLKPSDLLLAENHRRFRPLFHQWVDLAEENLQAGWDYVLNLPYRWVRVRLACAWPVLIGLATLQKLRNENVLNPEIRIKVSRREIRAIIYASVASLAFPFRWKTLPQRVCEKTASGGTLIA